MEKWSLSKLPPKDHPDVGRFFWGQFEKAIAERDRLGLADRWLSNHRLWRIGASTASSDDASEIRAQLIFANVNRTVANLTAKNPAAEVHSLEDRYELTTDGQIATDENGEKIKDDADVKVSEYVRTWWNESEQEGSLVDTALNMEIYGITIEKGVFNSDAQETEIVVVDPYSFVIPAGNWDSPNDAPFCGQAYPERPEAIEAKFGLEEGTVRTDDSFQLLGGEREDNRVHINEASTSPYGTETYHSRGGARSDSEDALILELFVRDGSKTKEGEFVYPGGIRFVSITNNGELVLVDKGNPNVNPELPPEHQANTYLWDHFPYSFAVSYRDTSSMWGFAAAEQVGSLAEKIGRLLTRVYRYVERCLCPPFILPKDTGLTADDVDNGAGLILTPSDSQSAAGIRLLPVPSLPADFFRLYDTLITLFDRSYQIEDADRGDTPNRVIAASAIMALQERNAVLMKHKIRALDYLIRQRGRIALSFFQNFGILPETVKIGDETKEIKGIDLADRRFKYVVESGSTVAQTTLQVQEQAIDLANQGHIDSQGLLETLNFPGAKEIIERMSGNVPIEAAASSFVKNGVPPEVVDELVALVGGKASASV